MKKLTRWLWKRVFSFCLWFLNRNLDEIEHCDHCELRFDSLWEAKDGRNYCDNCYNSVFYPSFYGFTREDFLDGMAGYDEDGNPVHKIH